MYIIGIYVIQNKKVILTAESKHLPTVVGSKGQIVIEKDIRKRLGIKPGAIAIQTIVGERVEVRFVPPAHTESLFGVLAPHVRGSVKDEDWGETKRRAWETAVNERNKQPYLAASESSGLRRRRKAARNRK